MNQALKQNVDNFLTEMKEDDRQGGMVETEAKFQPPEEESGNINRRNLKRAAKTEGLELIKVSGPLPFCSNNLT